MTERLQYTLEYIAKKHLEEIRQHVDEGLSSLSIEQVGIIEESLVESEMIAELCLTSCEECDKYMTHDCVRNILTEKYGDQWCEGICCDSYGTTADDYLEMKRYRDINY